MGQSIVALRAYRQDERLVSPQYLFETLAVEVVGAHAGKEVGWAIQQQRAPLPAFIPMLQDGSVMPRGQRA